MWICKHCEMPNQDGDNECYLCGKPQKEPTTVEKKKEKKTTAKQGKGARSHNKEQPSVDEFSSVLTTASTHEQKIESPSADVDAPENDEELISRYFGSSSRPKKVAASSDADKKIPKIDKKIPPLATESAEQPQTESDKPTEQPVEPAQENTASKENSVDFFDYTEGENDAVNEAKPKNEDPSQLFVVTTEQPAENEKTQQSYMYGSSAAEEPKKTSNFNFQDLLAIVQQDGSDDINEEIRRKQSEQKKQKTTVESVQKKAKQRAAKKEAAVRHRQEAVAMFSKVTVNISRVVVVVFLILACAFLGVCIWRGNAENVSYTIDEILYMFELQLREVLESMQLGF